MKTRAGAVHPPEIESLGPDEFGNRQLASFLDGLVSHYVLDGGRNW